MASPLFKAARAPHYSTHIPRSLSTALFVHRMKSSLAPKSRAIHAGGHPIIHQPIVVRPARASHTSNTQLVNANGQLPMY
jgi:hypothetical protein